MTKHTGRLPSVRHPDCTCGKDQDGRWQTCQHHATLNARLDGLKDKRPLPERIAEAMNNTERWYREHGVGH